MSNSLARCYITPEKRLRSFVQWSVLASLYCDGVAVRCTASDQPSSTPHSPGRKANHGNPPGRLQLADLGQAHMRPFSGGLFGLCRGERGQRVDSTVKDGSSTATSVFPRSKCARIPPKQELFRKSRGFLNALTAVQAGRLTLRSTPRRSI